MLARPQAEFIERTTCINCNSSQLAEISRGRYSDQPLAGFLDADPWGESPMPYLQSAEWILVRLLQLPADFPQTNIERRMGTGAGSPRG
jgi:hypothetical protein